MILGKQLATGGFGTVYLASLMDEDGSATPVVVKKAKDFGEGKPLSTCKFMCLIN